MMGEGGKGGFKMFLTKRSITPGDIYSKERKRGTPANLTTKTERGDRVGE